jgi:lipopolysaccharide heptosyltransferase I
VSGTRPSPRNLLVVRLGAMGDVIHTLPAAAMLRRAFPDAQIGWVIEERWAELLCAKGATRSGPTSPTRPLIDFVHLVNTKSWRKSPLSDETRRQFSAALKEIRNQKYEVAIDFQGAIKSALLSRLSGAATVYGMQEPRETPARMFYARRVRTSGAHVIEQYQSLAEAVVKKFVTTDCRTELDRTGVGGRPHMEPTTSSVPFPRDEAAEASIAEQLRNVAGDIVILSPGAGWATKEWPPERYGEIARALANKGFAPIVNYGPGEEPLARAVETASNGVARPMTCSLAELIALTRRATLFIGGDTGPLHLAAALDVPVVAIFGPTDPARNGPYGGRSIVLRNAASRTSLSHTSTPDPGLLRITPDEVLSAAQSLLEDASG